LSTPAATGFRQADRSMAPRRRAHPVASTGPGAPAPTTSIDYWQVGRSGGESFVDGELAGGGDADGEPVQVGVVHRGKQERLVGNVGGETPRVIASRANSGQVHRVSGTPAWAGSSQARALTSATTAAGNTRGRPLQGRSASPTPPCWQNRLRHLRTVSSCTPNRRAMAALGSPSAAASTIRARSTWRCSARPPRARRSSVCRSASSSVTTYGLRSPTGPPLKINHEPGPYRAR
jgi:hypothetical protein